MEKKWEEPAFSEVKMDAEIGAYQDDFEPAPVPLAWTRAPLGTDTEVKSSAVE